jgi:hypothetical protein
MPCAKEKYLMKSLTLALIFCLFIYTCRIESPFFLKRLCDRVGYGDGCGNIDIKGIADPFFEWKQAASLKTFQSCRYPGKEKSTSETCCFNQNSITSFRRFSSKKLGGILNPWPAAGRGRRSKLPSAGIPGKLGTQTCKGHGFFTEVQATQRLTTLHPAFWLDCSSEYKCGCGYKWGSLAGTPKLWPIYFGWQ